MGSSGREFLAGQVVGPGIYRSAVGAEVVMVEVGYLPASTGKLERYRQVEGFWLHRAAVDASDRFVH